MFLKSIHLFNIAQKFLSLTSYQLFILILNYCFYLFNLSFSLTFEVFKRYLDCPKVLKAWRKVLDPETNSYYYENTLTWITTWTQPKGYQGITSIIININIILMLYSIIA